MTPPWYLNLQDQTTELADTPGSRFAADCATLIGEGQLSELLSHLLSQSDLLFSKAADKGQLRWLTGQTSCPECEHAASCRCPINATACNPHRVTFCADLECCINVICHLVARVPPQAAAAAAQQVAQSLTAKVGVAL